MSPPSAAGPLAGLKVVEVAGIGPGPYAAMLLADLGAEVIRVDRPGMEGQRSNDPTLRSRRSITLDLKKADAVDACCDWSSAATCWSRDFGPAWLSGSG